MLKIGIMTLGCRVNQYESQSISEELSGLGYEINSFNEDCDVYIINTCTVTSSSDKKSRQMISRALAKKKEKPNTKVCAIGCFTQNKFQIQKCFSVSGLDGIDIIGGNSGKSSIARVIHEYISSGKSEPVNILKDISEVCEFENLSLTKSKNTRAYLKVQDGCDNFCTYCIVPVVRGRVRSKPIEEVRNDLFNLRKEGYNEVVFCGIEISAYQSGLVELAKAAEKAGFDRVRFGSMNPTTSSEGFIRNLSDIDAVMPHFHLSVQSASDTVLKNMGRNYTSHELYKSIESIHKYFKNATLSCDLICGFPGETEKDFEDTLSFVSSNEITHAHIFPYSKREGTPAATFKNQIPEAIKKERCSRLCTVSDIKLKEIFEKYRGDKFSVLIENKKGDFYFGHTENFLPVALRRKCTTGTFESVILGKEFGIFADETAFIVD